MNPQPPDPAPPTGPSGTQPWPPQALPYQGGWADPYQQTRDADHLRVLSICHYVWGGVTLLFSSCGLFYLFLGLTVARDPAALGGGQGQPPPPAEMAYFFVAMGAAIALVGWTVGGLTIYSGRCIAARRKRILSFVMAGVNCISFPVGTTLGVFTFIVLLRDSVRAAYATPNP